MNVCVYVGSLQGKTECIVECIVNLTLAKPNYARVWGGGGMGGGKLGGWGGEMDDGSVCMCVCISTMAAVRYQHFLLRDKAVTVSNGSGRQECGWMSAFNR